MSVVSWVGDWSDPGGLGGWGQSQIGPGGSITIEPSVLTVPGGFQSAKFIRPDTAVLDSNQGATRVEVAYPSGQSGPADGALVVFGSSINLDPSWAGIEYGDGPSWTVNIQNHGADSQGLSPPIAVGAASLTKGGPIQWFAQINGGVTEKGNAGQLVVFGAGKATGGIGSWRHILISGYRTSDPAPLAIYVLDQGDTGWTQVISANSGLMNTVAGQKVLPTYWKVGDYEGPENKATGIHLRGRSVLAPTLAEAGLNLIGIAA